VTAGISAKTGGPVLIETGDFDVFLCGNREVTMNSKQAGI
jgi:hypothetical protein